MAKYQKLKPDRSLLQAVSLCSEGNLSNLQTFLAHTSDVLGTELVLRVLLTYLPAGAEPVTYVPILKSLLARSQAKEVTDDLGTQIETLAVERLSDDEAGKRVRQLHLLPLESSDRASNASSDGDLLERFLVQRAHQIDAETSNLVLILQLIEPFIDRFESLRTWVISRLLPLLRLDYQYYPEKPTALSVKDFESLEAKTVIGILLKNAEDVDLGQNIGRDLRELVGPWMHGSTTSKRRKLDTSDESAPLAGEEQHEWQAVNEWLLGKGPMLARKAFKSWSGPGDVDLGGYEGTEYSEDDNITHLRSRYLQAAFATIYAQKDGSEDLLEGAREICDRVGDIMGVSLAKDDQNPVNLPQLSTYDSWVTQEKATALLQNALLIPSNRLTMPSIESYRYLRALLQSAQILRSLHHYMPIAALAELSLFAGKDIQQQELRKVLQSLGKSKPSAFNWRLVYEQVLWLRSWGSQSGHDQPSGKIERALFWQVDQEYIDSEFLTTLVAAGQYSLAIELYLQPPSTTLLAFECETIVEACIYSSYDNASNGNRSRGGIKRASDILKAFSPHLPQSQSFRRIEPLLAATHSLSFYHLTLEHGVPFQPVSIRVHSDPISLVEKVLEQNQGAYTKLDDLLSIGQNLVAAGLPAHESQSQTQSRSFSLSSHASPVSPDVRPDHQQFASTLTSHRIISFAITSALSSNDFDTAYSYIQTRLAPSPSHPEEPSSYSQSSDAAWRAAYAAGRYRPPAPSSAGKPLPLHAQITLLSKRMELLSLALTLAPDPAVLPEILATWRRCEEELGSLKERESEEEKAWDERVDSSAASAQETGMPGEWGDINVSRERDERENAKVRMARERDRRKGLGGKGRRGGWGEEEEEEAPMGLFDVARGAVRAVGKSAFPLRPAAAAGQRGVGGEGEGERSGGLDVDDKNDDEDNGNDDSGEMARFGFGFGDARQVEHQHSEGEGERDRLRKRDMVSSMVTGGLVKGVGWMLGAEPVERRGGEERRRERE